MFHIPVRRQLVMGGGRHWRTLPQNLDGVGRALIVDFEGALTDWTVTNGTKAVNTTAGQFYTGTQGMKLTRSAATTQASKTGFTLGLTAAPDTTRMHIYIDYATWAAINNLTWVRLILTDGTNAFRLAWLVADLTQGMNHLMADAADWVVHAGTPSWADMTVVAVSMFTAVGGPPITFDSVYLGARAGSALIITFADGNDNQYTAAHPILRARNIRASFFVPTAKIGTAAHVTWAQLEEMYVWGHDVGSHGTGDVNGAGEARWTLADTAADPGNVGSVLNQTKVLQDAYDAIVSYGLTRAARHCIAPSNAYDANTLTALAATVPAVLSCAMGSYTRKIVLPAGTPYLDMGYAGDVTETSTPAQLMAMIDDAKAKGYVLVFGCHGVGGAGQLTAPDFTTVMNYVVSSGIAVATIGDLWNLESGPVRVRA